MQGLTTRAKNFDITIVGLGPGGRQHLTLEAQQVLRGASEIYLRTKQHPVVHSLLSKGVLHSFDYLYEEKESFRDIYEEIANRILDLATRPEGVVYAVPGHPLVAEESVRLILRMAKEKGLTVRIVSGVSFLDPLFTLLELDPITQGLQVVDATLLVEYSEAWNGPPGSIEGGRRYAAASLWARQPFEPTVPLIIGQLHNRAVASAVKLVLQEFYPSDHSVTLVRWAGIEGKEEKRSLALFELDRQSDIDHLTSLYVPSIPIGDDLAAVAGLRHVIARLRAPGGCPWDRKQTHASLKPHVIEEAYEVVDALDAGDKDKLCEELGDLLLQIVLHSQLATEDGEFLMEDVCRGINSKLIRRHPHIFAEQVVADAEEVLRNWEQIKKEEKGEGTSSLNNLPKSMPALAYAQSIQRRAARLGFDWKEIAGVIDKVAEETRELASAKSASEREQEFGDLLFALVNVARWLDINAEDALRLASKKFVRRFNRVEELCAQRGLDMEKLTLEELDELWEESKSGEKDAG